MATHTNLPIQSLNPTNQPHMGHGHNPYMPIISPVPTQGPTSALQKRRFVTPTLPDAYADRSLVIQDTIEQIIFTADQRWPTTRICPIRQVDEMKLTLKVWTAHPAFMSVVPERAIGQLTSQSHTSETVNLIPFGIASELEHGYEDTPEGQFHLGLTLRQLANAWNETANMEVFNALLRTHDPVQTWLSKHGIVAYKEFEEYLKYDKMVVGYLQKEKNALEKLDAQIKMIMREYGGEADSYILSEDLAVYATLVRKEKTDYYMGGQEAVDRVNGKPNGYGNDQTGVPLFDRVDPIYWVRENQVFISRVVAVENAPRVDPFRRHREIGTYNVVENNTPVTSDYRSHDQAIQIFNMDKDQFDVIDLDYCVDNCGLFDPASGNLLEINAPGNDPMAKIGVKEDPFTNSAGPVSAIGDIHPKYLGDEYFSRLVKALSDRNARASLVTADNVFVKKDAAGNTQVQAQFTANVMPADNANIGQMVLNIISGAVENAPGVSAQLQEIAKSRGSVEERAGRMYDVLESNIQQTSFNNEVDLEDWFKDNMRQYREHAARGAGTKAFSVPNIEDVPFFKKSQQPANVEARRAPSGRSAAGLADVGAFFYDGGEEGLDDLNVPRPQPPVLVLSDTWKAWYETMKMNNLNDDQYLAVLSVLGEPFIKATLKRMIRMDIPLPLNFIIARPHCRFETRTIIKVASNGQAGYTYVFGTRVETGNDVAQMLKTINMRSYLRCFMHRPQNVMIIPDVYVMGYHGGMGIIPFTNPDQYNNHDVDIEEERSVFVLAVPADEKTHGRNALPNPMSITGRFPQRYQDRVQRPHFGHYTTWYRYKQLWSFGAGMENNLDTMPRMHGEGHVNYIMYLGRQNRKHPVHNQWAVEFCNTGHLGYTYQGCRDVWDGRLKELAEYGTRG